MLSALNIDQFINLAKDLGLPNPRDRQAAYAAAVGQEGQRLSDKWAAEAKAAGQTAEVVEAVRLLEGAKAARQSMQETLTALTAPEQEAGPELAKAVARFAHVFQSAPLHGSLDAPENAPHHRAQAALTWLGVNAADRASLARAHADEALRVAKAVAEASAELASDEATVQLHETLVGALVTRQAEEARIRVQAEADDLAAQLAATYLDPAWVAPEPVEA